MKTAGKRVGVTENGLNVSWMQQDKFERAERLLPDYPLKIPEPVIISSPFGARRYSRDYYKAKFDKKRHSFYAKIIADVVDQMVNARRRT